MKFIKNHIYEYNCDEFTEIFIVIEFSDKTQSSIKGEMLYSNLTTYIDNIFYFSKESTFADLCKEISLKEAVLKCLKISK